MSNVKKVRPNGPTVSQVLAETARMDGVRRQQIANQVLAINRLLVDGSYGKEMQELHHLLAIAMAENAELHAQLIDKGDQAVELLTEEMRSKITYRLGRKR